MELRHLSGRRRGVSSLAVVAVLIGVIVLLLLTNSTRSGWLQSRTIQHLLGTNAQLTAMRSLHLARARLTVLFADPKHPQYIPLRKAVLEAAIAHRELDISSWLVDLDEGSALSWNGTGVGTTRPLGDIETQISARIDALEPASAIGTAHSPDELNGQIHFSCRCTVKLARTSQTRTVESSHEFYISIAGPPRPFADAALYLADLNMVTRQSEIESFRQSILETYPRVISKLASIPSTFDTKTREGLEDIRAEIPIEFESRMPALPADQVSIFGPHELRSLSMQSLDLAGRLREEIPQLATSLARFESLLDEGGRAYTLEGTRHPALAALIEVMQLLNRAGSRFWSFSRHFKVQKREDVDPNSSIIPWEPRLEVQTIRDRARVRLNPGNPVWEDWQTGKRALIGVVHLVSAEPVLIRGPRYGRVLLVVDAPCPFGSDA